MESFCISKIDMMIVSQMTYLDVHEDAKLIITNNIMNRSDVFMYFVGLEMNAIYNIEGDFTLKNNKIYNCIEENGAYGVAALWADPMNSQEFNTEFNIGSGVITISDNKAYSDRGVTLADDSDYSHVYQVYTLDVGTLFSIKSYLNSNSLIDGIKLEPDGGTIINGWNTIMGDSDIYKSIFKVDKFGHPDRQVFLVDNNVVITKAIFEVSFYSFWDRIDTQYVDIFGKVEEPTPPVMEGWTFGGWYEDRDCTTVFDFNTEITKDTQIYCKWIENEYTITYHLNEGSFVSDYEAPTKRMYSEGVLLPTNENVTRTGYTFAGWYDNSSFEGFSSNRIRICYCRE